MPEPAITTYRGKPCRSTEMKVGNTVFTVISVQSEKAAETACDKVKRLLLADLAAPGERYQKVHK